MKVAAWILVVIVIGVLAILVYALARSNVDPVVWQPGPNPGLSGEFAPNDAIASAKALLDGVGFGPEDIALGPDGWMYTGYRDGRIVRFRADGDYQEFVDTGGYPLGMRFDKDSKLIVADSDKGVLSISPNGAIEVLANSVDGEPIKFIDGLDVAEEGTIWFTDASMRFSHHENLYIFVEGRATGRLLSYSRETREVTVRLEGLSFANGVAVAPGDEFVLVSETAAVRIRRLWLKGDKAGNDDIFIEGLPGTPDNLSVDDDGTFWAGIAGLRDPKFEALAERPFVRRLMGALPVASLAPGGTHAFVIGMDSTGKVTHNLQDPDSRYSTTTSATRVGDQLYITGLNTDAIGVLEL
jgi:sugar lactone lactonase YvrE